MLFLKKSLLIHKFYKERKEWVSVDSNMDEEFESYAQFLRPGELVGLDCIEQYLPHCVAKQFGLDQDLPASYLSSMKHRMLRGTIVAGQSTTRNCMFHTDSLSRMSPLGI